MKKNKIIIIIAVLIVILIACLTISLIVFNNKKNNLIDNYPDIKDDRKIILNTVSNKFIADISINISDKKMILSYYHNGDTENYETSKGSYYINYANKEEYIIEDNNKKVIQKNYNNKSFKDIFADLILSSNLEGVGKIGTEKIFTLKISGNNFKKFINEAKNIKELYEEFKYYFDLNLQYQDIYLYANVDKDNQLIGINIFDEKNNTTILFEI